MHTGASRSWWIIYIYRERESDREGERERIDVHTEPAGRGGLYIYI